MAGLENLREYTSLTINENEQLWTVSGLSVCISVSDVGSHSQQPTVA